MRRNFVEEFKRRCALIDHNEHIPRVLHSTEYQVEKINGNTRKIVATGLTLNEAMRFLRLTRSRLNSELCPNDRGEPYFSLKTYKLRIEHEL